MIKYSEFENLLVTKIKQSNLDTMPVINHIYDHSCRCICCQKREIVIQKNITQDKKDNK